MPDIELQMQMDQMQHMLHPHYILRVWRARSTDIIAELPLPLVEHIIGLFLAQGNLAAASIAVQEAPRKPLASAPSRAALRAVGLPLRPVQEARRAARRANSAHKKGGR